MLGSCLVLGSVIGLMGTTAGPPAVEASRHHLISSPLL